MAGQYFRSLIKNGIFQNVFESEIATAGLALFVAVLLVYWKWGKKKYNLPPGPTGVPILGYLPFLGQKPYKDFDRLKEKYGNVFSLYMGNTLVVILADYEAVKDGFSKSSTTDRPIRLFDLFPDGVGLSSVNGSEWLEQRKFCMKTMRELGLGRDKWESMIKVEVEDFVTLLSSVVFNGQPIEICEILSSSISNNISSFVFGKRIPLNDPNRKFLDNIIDEIMKFFNQASITNFYPIIRDISIALGIGPFAHMNLKLQKFNQFVKSEVAKSKESYKNEVDENFIVDYLKEMDKYKNKPGHYFNDSNLHGNIQALFIAGSETTRTSIHWLLIIMARYPNIQKKIQDEVDSVISNHKQVHWEQRYNMPYTFATIMEGQRWRTIAPLNTARIATEDVKIQGYDIPKGTHIIANNWGLHNDNRYWKKPEKFNPERFLTEDGTQVIMKPESYNPFSYGKRNCPGEVIAMMEILHYFTALMQKFTVLPPKDKEINLEENAGLTCMADKQELLFVLRK